MKNTIEINRSWIEGLIDYAKKCEETKPKSDYMEYDSFYHHYLPSLLGYIESSKLLLK